MKNDFPVSDFLSPINIGPQTRYGNNRWEVYSLKLRRNVTLYSNLEYDHWALVEADPEIKTFCEQPLKIQIRLPSGAIVTTIFDMWIRRKSGIEEFREIKFHEELFSANSKSRIVRQIEAQKKWCDLKGISYTVVTEKVIRADPVYLLNCKLILRHLGMTRHLSLALYSERIRVAFKQLNICSLGELENYFPDDESQIIRSAIFDLIISGQIKASLHDESFDKNTKLEIVDV